MKNASLEYKTTIYIFYKDSLFPLLHKMFIKNIDRKSKNTAFKR